MNIKRKWLWTLIALALAALTVYTVMSGTGMSLKDLAGMLHRASPFWLGAAILCMFGYIYFEGMAVRSILRACGYPRRRRQGIVYGAADVYFSAITPSATGGQPASAYFIIRDGAPGAVATAALLLNLIMYNAAILTLGFLAFLVRPSIFLAFDPICKVLILVGAVVILSLTSVFLLLLWKQHFMFHLAGILVQLLVRLRIIRHPEKLNAKIERTRKEYKQCVSILAGHRKMWLEAYLFNLLQRSSQIAVTAMSMLALGGRRKILHLVICQIFVALGANCVPIPGAMGVTDYMMLDGYTELLPDEFAFEVQMLSRSISFYFCIFVSAVIVLIGWLWVHHKRYKKTRNEEQV